MIIVILTLLLLSICWICGKFLGIPGYLGSIIGTVIYLLTFLSQ